MVLGFSRENNIYHGVPFGYTADKSDFGFVVTNLWVPLVRVPPFCYDY